MLEATRYTRIYGQQKLGKCLCVAESQPMQKICVLKLYSHKIFSYDFLYKNIFTIKVNYSPSSRLISVW